MTRSPRILLTSFMGLPYGMSFFVPDAGLDILCRTARQAGAEASILDFNHSGTLLACLDLERQKKLKSLLESQREDMSGLADILDHRNALRRDFFRAAEAHIHRELRRRIHADKVVLLCVKIWLGEAFASMRVVCDKLKAEFPGLKIALGGPAISTIGEEVLPLIGSCADFVALGEGEGALLGMIKLLRGEIAQEKDLPSCYYWDPAASEFRLSSGSPVDVSPPEGTPFFDSYGTRIWEEKIGLFLIDDSRGCAAHCPFCAHPFVNAPAKRDQEQTFRSFNRVYQSGGRLFRLTGSSPSPAFINALSRFILEHDLTGCMLSSFLFPTFIRALAADQARSAGFRAFLVGLESIDSSQKKNDFTGEKYPQAALDDIALAFASAGFFLSASMIFPQPDNDTSGLERFLSRRLIGGDMASFLVHFPTVYPRTQWWLDPERFGISIDGKEDYLRSLVLGDAPDDARLSLRGRRWDRLKSESRACKSMIRAHGYSTGTNDETALLAIGIGRAPRELDGIQRRQLAAFDFLEFEALRAEANLTIASLGRAGGHA